MLPKNLPLSKKNLYCSYFVAGFAKAATLLNLQKSHNFETLAIKGF
jgi:hypothetical protein